MALTLLIFSDWMGRDPLPRLSLWMCTIPFKVPDSRVRMMLDRDSNLLNKPPLVCEPGSARSEAHGTCAEYLILDICMNHRKLLYFGGIFGLDSWTLIKCGNVLVVPGFTVCIVKICWRIVSKMGDRPIRIQDDFETMQRLMNELGMSMLAFMKMGLWMWSINFHNSLIYLFNSSCIDCSGQFLYLLSCPSACIFTHILWID